MARAYGAQSWVYDGVGNRTQEISTAPGSSTSTTRTYSYPVTSNKLSSVIVGASTTERSFTYDVVSKTRLRHDAGNITADSRSGTAYAYAYNKRNRLNTVTVAASLKGTYTYVFACPPSAGPTRPARLRRWPECVCVCGKWAVQLGRSGWAAVLCASCRI